VVRCAGASDPRAAGVGLDDIDGGAVIVLGLTGSIGMGKSTAAAMLRRLGLPLYDADAEVHRLMAPGGAAVNTIEALFPGVRNEAGGIDRALLRSRVLGNPPALRRLEAVLHPLIRRVEKRVVRLACAHHQPVVVLDIPLLFETKSDQRCDCTLVVSAPPRIQRERVMRRPGMTAEIFAAIRRAQMPDREKRRRADFVVVTALGRSGTYRRLKEIVGGLRQGGLPCRRARGPGGRRRCVKL
jgi:dephospho-CoA kinase